MPVDVDMQLALLRVPIPLYIPYNWNGNQTVRKLFPCVVVRVEPTTLDFFRLKSQRTNHPQTICNLFFGDLISSNKCDGLKSRKSLEEQVAAVALAVDAAGGGSWRVVGMEASLDRSYCRLASTNVKCRPS